MGPTWRGVETKQRWRRGEVGVEDGAEGM
jgi:hypothetical protein